MKLCECATLCSGDFWGTRQEVGDYATLAEVGDSTSCSIFVIKRDVGWFEAICLKVYYRTLN